MRNYFDFEKTVRVHLLFDLFGSLFEAGCHQIQSFLKTLELRQKASRNDLLEFCSLLLSLQYKLWKRKTVLSEGVKD